MRRDTPLLYIFRRDTVAPSTYDSVLFGIFRAEHAPLFARVLLLIALLAAVSCAWLSRRRGARWLWASYGASCVAFAALSFLLSDPWDEVFVNLRHSDYLARYGSFSFQRAHPVEGIVDFLPYVTLGLLHKLGVPLFGSALLMSFAGGLACLGAMLALLRALGMSDSARALACTGLSLLPPLAYNSGQGFATTLLTAAALWSAYLVFFGARQRLGFVLLAIIPLIRLEGALFLALFWSVWFGQQLLQPQPSTYARFVRPLLLGAALAAPALALTAYRIVHFGFALPAPVRYKSTLGSPYFLGIGIDSLARDALGGGALGFVLLALVSVALLVGRLRDAAERRRLRLFVLLHAAFLIYVLPYYVSGGDWFPYYWGRYMLPFTAFSALAGGGLCWLAFTRGTPNSRRLLGASTLLLLAAYVLPGVTPSSLLTESALVQLWHDIQSPQAGRGNSRLQRLSQVGLHLGATTRPSDVIASSEIATVMFHAQREALDLLGVTNEEIIKQPLFEHALAWDLPPIFHRRKTPDLIARYQPAYLYPYDYYMQGGVGAPRLDEPDAVVAERLYAQLASCNKVMEFRGMKPARLFELGYTLVTALQRDFAPMYFVSKEALPSHLRALRGQGFVQTFPQPKAAEVHAAAP